MKYLSIIPSLFITISGFSQVSVFDCSVINPIVTETEINTTYNFHKQCVLFEEQQNYQFGQTDQNKVTANESITIKEGFHTGPYTDNNHLWLKIEEKSIYDVAVLNYPDLDQVQKFKKLEFGIDLKNSAINDDIETRIKWFLDHPSDMTNYAINPFLSWELDIIATFKHVETGQLKTRSAFYFHDYTRNANNLDWDDVNYQNDFIMRLRFAPPLPGLWEVEIQIKDHGSVTETLPTFAFNVVENNHPGFVKVHQNKKNFQRGNKIIYPLGHTMPGPYNGVDIWGWEPTGRPTNETAKVDDYISYMDDVRAYVNAGGKYFKTTQTAYSNLVEFENMGNYSNRMHYAWEQDFLIDYCEENDVLIDFNLLFQDVIFQYGQSGGTGSSFDGWGVCPGGFEPVPWDYGHKGPNGQTNPCDNTPTYGYHIPGTLPSNMFLSNTLYNENKQIDPINGHTLMNYHEQRTRYYISRYGYSPQIYMFELISEPFHMNADLAHQPAIEPNDTEYQESIDAINAYHNSISSFIKENLGHTDHLLCMQQYRLDELDKYYNSSENANIDIIGHNPYLTSPEKLITKKELFHNSIYTIAYNNNNIQSGEESRYKIIEDFKSLHQINKPIFITEAGSGTVEGQCSKQVNHYVDVMTLGFSGYAGLHIWEGYSHPINGVGEPDLRFLWESTIRAEQHMNGDDVISVLSNNNGNWKQGRQYSQGQLNNHPYREIQYYLSDDKNMAVGYVRNRTYNFHTKWITNPCHDGSFYISSDYDNLINTSWNRNLHKLAIQGLYNKKNYSTSYYSFKEGAYLSTNCRTTKGANSINAGCLELEHPKLWVIGSDIASGKLESPVLWFVIKKDNCSKNLEVDPISENRINHLSPQIYPNPSTSHIQITHNNPIGKILIYNTQGVLIKAEYVERKEKELILPKGIYIINFIEYGVTKKVIII